MTRNIHNILAVSALISIGVFMGGCSSDDSAVTADSTRYEAANEGGTEDSDAANRLGALHAPASSGSSSPNSDTTTMSNPAAAIPPVVDGLFDDTELSTGGLTPLAEDASVEEALSYFENTNDALRNLMNSQSHFASPEQQLAEAKRISKMKLAAAEQVLSSEAIDNNTSVIASRNKLEALSQLAGLQDVGSAKELEAYANELSSSSNPQLVNESRVVRLGFALERIRNGQNKTPDELLELTDEITAAEGELGMPAFFALQQCFTVLGQYGYDDAARNIRDRIAEKFAGHSDPQISQAAQRMASGARFDNLDRLRRKLGQGQEVPSATWHAAIDELVTESKDIGTFQYLAGLALNSEALGNTQLSEYVFTSIENAFVQGQDPEEPLTKEAQAFIAASIARRDVIGKPIDIHYPDLAGGEIDWASYRGSVVALPFWITSQPQSMMVIPMLQELQAKHAGKLKVLGINLDDSDEDLAAFRNSYQVAFPSVRNADPANRSIRDPLAKQMGVASFPFIAVVDPDGRVVKILMGPQPDLEKSISQLIKPSE